VACARIAYNELLLRKTDPKNVDLMIGRMRPFDRDQLTKKLQRVFRSGSEELLDNPHFVVATQCLEVGADLDFDGMVCQCASLDAVRQRFGRLNRLGKTGHARGVVVMAMGDVNPRKADPIYAEALPETWQWFMSHAKDSMIDVGINALDRLLGDTKTTLKLTAPAPDAPVLMPAHLDMLCQTGPRPALEPDVSAFLHGPQRGIPEIRICWRADLPPISHGIDEWASTCNTAITACPPSSAECMNVPLPRFRDWLLAAETQDTFSDVLGEFYEDDQEDSDRSIENETSKDRSRYGLIWRGGQCQAITNQLSKRKLQSIIQPNTTIVLPACVGGWDFFGHVPAAPVDPAVDPEADSDVSVIDIASTAYYQSRAKHILRIHRSLVTTDEEDRLLKPLLDYAKDPNASWHPDLLLSPTRDEINEFDHIIPDELPYAYQERMHLTTSTMDELHKHRNVIKHIRYHDGVAIIGPRILSRVSLPRESFGDDSDEHNLDAEARLPLETHLADVAAETERISTALAIPLHLAKALSEAAERHDLGKADPRFQAKLLGSAIDMVWMQPTLWAKSARAGMLGRSSSAVEMCLPDGFRHEMLSLEIAKRLENPLDISLKETMLHIIAAHHGHARPFAPVVSDDYPPEVNLGKLNRSYTSAGEVKIGSEECRHLIPAHRLDSGISQRFWKLNRRYGWWGICWLESLVRLADWVASAEPNKNILPWTLPSVITHTKTDQSQPNQLSCVGLNGANPLGFLAALGLFRHIATKLDSNCHMYWHIRNGIWCPKFISSDAALTDEQALLKWLETALKVKPDSHGLIQLNETEMNRLGLTRPNAYSDAVQQSAISNREMSDWLSCNGSDLCDPKSNCQLQIPRRDNFPKNVKGIISKVTYRHYERSLFHPWDYADPIKNVSLHLEPREDRRHAYQWHMPSGDPTRSLHGGMIGANRLAMEAWPLFQSVSVHGELQTIGFQGTRPARGICWTWPLWTAPINIDDVSPLLNQAFSQSKTSSRLDTSVYPIATRGIGCLFQLRRILVEKTPNFTTPVALFTQNLSKSSAEQVTI
jgi:CRISPR-associated endonuclease/helicase Cas3